MQAERGIGSEFVWRRNLMQPFDPGAVISVTLAFTATLDCIKRRTSKAATNSVALVATTFSTIAQYLDLVLFELR